MCGGLRLEPTGFLRAPDTDADGYYDNDVDCLWIIVAPEDTLIEFEVLQIVIEPATRACFFDFLEVCTFVNYKIKEDVKKILKLIFD